MYIFTLNGGRTCTEDYSNVSSTLNLYTELLSLLRIGGQQDIPLEIFAEKRF
jgi:hypothetical protein